MPDPNQVHVRIKRPFDPDHDDHEYYPHAPGSDHVRCCHADNPQVAQHDPVDHPRHYTSHASGVECITITEHMTFCLGNAMKYIWRAGEKGDAIEDLRKAVFYINREIARLARHEGDRPCVMSSDHDHG